MASPSLNKSAVEIKFLDSIVNNVCHKDFGRIQQRPPRFPRIDHRLSSSCPWGRQDEIQLVLEDFRHEPPHSRTKDDPFAFDVLEVTGRSEEGDCEQEQKE